MAEVWPFAGTRYHPKENEFDPKDVLAPPFDDIDSRNRKGLHEKSPYNIVRLIQGHEAASDDEVNNRYSRAAECYRDWKARGILQDEQRKCFYVYEQEFKLPGRKEPVKRLGFFALVKLQDFRSGKTRSFELTFDSPKSDRLRLLRQLQVNDSPLYMLYKDQEATITAVLNEVMGKGEPSVAFVDDEGTSHKLWLIHKKDPILRIHEAMKDKRLFIAHGHHRYETALKYRDEMREMTGRRDGRQPFDFSLMYLQRAEDDTLFTEPFHRMLARELGLDIDVTEVIEDLEEFYQVAEFKVNMKDPAKGAAALEAKIKPTARTKVKFAMVLPNGRAWTLTLKKDADLDEMIEEETMSAHMKSIDVVLLHRFVISRGWIGNPEVELDEDDIIYRRSIAEGLSLLARRKSCVGFFLNPLSKEEVLQVAENGELLPHCSVNFFPKIPSGLVLRDLNVGFG